MTVKVTAPALNLREKLSELDKPSGIAGQDILKADTPQEVFNYIGAGRRNLIINGAMQVAQRGTTGYDNGYDSVDRFSWNPNGMDQMGGNSLQSTDAPNGFSNSFGIQVTTAETTISADESFNCRYEVEARDLQGIANGTSDAKSLTLSFWVKSSVTGTYTVALYKDDNTARLITSTYTISTANTWEQKTFTFAGDTSGGGINNDSGSGLSIVWWLTAGSNKTSTNSTSWMNYAEGGYAYGQTADLASTLNSSWYITGVQLEVGSVATPFEHRSYGEELALCQRYYQVVGYYDTSGSESVNTMYYVSKPLTVAMRAAPTLVADYAFGTLSGRLFTKAGANTYYGAVGLLATQTAVCVKGTTSSIINTIYGDTHWDAEL